MAVRPALLYGSECWPVKEDNVHKLHTMEMKMLRWSRGITRLDRVRNEYVRGSFKVAPIPEKLTENRLRCFEHVMRRDDEYIVKKALDLQENNRGRGRPPATSMATLLDRNNLPDPTTLDRMSWRTIIRRADPT
ncbi:uncharacterized protein LOC133529880 [Cydia pomonella]|uniref:uncharacterized protein LOC133529880 n=1 Tax=Cydia pomonella TaxID=82600 RepID=UPI002ADE6EF5|nr:uncharacterized protein LOC133529880 [Cydia pomonella]